MIISRLKFFKYIILSILFTGILISNTRICEFHARRENSVVILEWATESESNLDCFNIQRSSDKVNWSKIGSVDAGLGNSSAKKYYQFEDKNTFKTNSTNFYYKLIMIDKNNNTEAYAVIASISGNSGIKHTWGSLKAMFR